MRKIFFIVLALFTIFTISCGRPVSKDEAQAKLETVEPTKIEISAETGAEISTARNLYFVFDGSGSMDDDCAGEDKIVGAKNAVHKFMEKVPKEVNLGLYVFDNNGDREVVPLASDNKKEFLKAIDDVFANGGTPLAEAIKFGTDQLVKQYQKQFGYGEYKLVVVTDGQASGIPEAAQYATKYKIPIYAIGLCIEGDHPLRSYALSYKAADDFKELEKGLEETLSESDSYDATEFQVATKK